MTDIYRVYVIQLEGLQLGTVRLCIAVVHRWELRTSRNSRVHVPRGDVYYADGCPAQGYRLAILRDIVIPSIRGYRGRTHVGNVEPHQLGRFEDVLAATTIRDACGWAFHGLRRLNAHHLEVPIYDPEPVWKGLDAGRKAWERGED